MNPNHAISPTAIDQKFISVFFSIIGLVLGIF
jgi:hypothetical protein